MFFLNIYALFVAFIFALIFPICFGKSVEWYKVKLFVVRFAKFNLFRRHPGRKAYLNQENLVSENEHVPLLDPEFFLLRGRNSQTFFQQKRERGENWKIYETHDLLKFKISETVDLSTLCSKYGTLLFEAFQFVIQCIFYTINLLVLILE